MWNVTVVLTMPHLPKGVAHSQQSTTENIAKWFPAVQHLHTHTYNKQDIFKNKSTSDCTLSFFLAMWNSYQLIKQNTLTN